MKRASFAMVGSILLSTVGLSTAALAQAAPLATGVHEPTLNGVRMWYRVAGRKQGVPVVYLAGGPGGNHYEFAALTGPSVEPRHRMIYFDGRGTGKSERPASGDYLIATLVDDIEALRRHLGVKRIAVMAHSFAGILALEYAARYPRSTAALVLVGGVWNMPASCQERIDNYAVIAPRAHAEIMKNGPPPRDKACAATFFAPRAAFEKANDESMFPIASTLDKQRKAQAASGLKNTGELSQAVFKQELLT